MKLLPELVAFDIGTQALKSLVISQGKSGAGFQIDDLVLEEIPDGLVGGGFTSPFIRDIPAFSRHLQKLIKKMSSQKQGCIVGLPDRWVKLHIQELVLKENEINNKEFLSWRLGKILPIPENLKVVIDHQILRLEECEDGYAVTVLAGVICQKMVELLSQLFASLQLQVMAFESSTVSVYNLLEEAQPENSIDRNLIMCHVGHETTVIKIYHQGILVYERVIEVGGEEIGNIYATAEQLTAEQSLQKKKELVLFSEDRASLVHLLHSRNLLEKIFANWLRELNVTFRFYQEKFKVLHLPKIYLTGGSCLFQGMPEFLSAYFETDCYRFNPFMDLPMEKEIPEQQQLLGPQFAPCLSLLTV